MKYHLEWPRYSFAGLLAGLIFLFVIAPFFQDGKSANTILQVSVVTLLLFSIYVLSKSRKKFIIATLLAVPALIANWTSFVTATQTASIAALTFNLFFFAFIIYIMFRNVFMAKVVSINIIFGAICVYLLIGLEWGFLYTILEGLVPNSFVFDNGETALQDMKEQRLRYLLYYSFVTLTTLGYGDIIPATAPARSFANLEAITGQVYLTVLVARLVGVHISQRGTFTDK